MSHAYKWSNATNSYRWFYVADGKPCGPNCGGCEDKEPKADKNAVRGAWSNGRSCDND